LQQPRLAPIYQLIISKQGHLDCLDVNVELCRGANCAKLERDGVERALETQIKSMIGVNSHIHVLDSGSIERTATGKAKRIVDKR
jgi:phenylacetate-CoA ligase